MPKLYLFTIAGQPHLTVRSSDTDDDDVGTYPTDATITAEHDTPPNLTQNATILSVRDGNWSDARTWNVNRRPQDGDIVGIKTTHTVLFDVALAIVDGVGIAGTLKFRTDINTCLMAQNIVIYGPNTLGGNRYGELRIGSSGMRVQADKTAQLVIRDSPLLDQSDGQYSNGVLCWGRIRFYGHYRTPFLRCTTEPQENDTSLTLASTITGWRQNDVCYLPDSRADYVLPEHIEFPVVSSVSGAVVNFVDPLAHDHPGMRDYQNTLERCPHIANITRNIIVRSENENGTLGHFQVFSRSDVKFHYAEFRNLGRTTSALLNPVTNHVGRYPLHIHHMTGPADNGQTYQFEIVGCVVQDTRTFTRTLVGGAGGLPFLTTQDIKWGITVHDSHWGLIQGNFVRNYTGWGIGTELGSETNNVFDGNWCAEIATNVSVGFAQEDSRAGSSPPEWGHTGSAYWFAGQNNYVRNNIATNCAPYSYSPYNVATSTVTIPTTQGVPSHDEGEDVIGVSLPVLEWLNNEAYGSVIYGMRLWFVGAFTVNSFPSVEPAESLFEGDCFWGVMLGGYFNYPSSNVRKLDSIIRGSLNSTNVAGVVHVDYTQVGEIYENPDIQLCVTGFGQQTRQRNPYGAGSGDMHLIGGILANKHNFYRGLMGAVSGIFEPRKFTITDTQMVTWTGRGTPTYDIRQDFPPSGSDPSAYAVIGLDNPVVSDILDLVNVDLSGDVVTGRVYFNDAQEPGSLVPVLTAAFDGDITGATNASPIVITTPDQSFMDMEGVRLVIAGVGGNTAANGTWTITPISDTTFSLNGSTGNGNYTSGGTWTLPRGQPSATKTNTNSLAEDGFCIAGEITPGTAATHSRIFGGKLDET